MAGGSFGTTGAVCIFIAVLLAYTLQTELAQYLQQTAGYKKPYFLFYLTHSGYLLLAPLHLCGMRILSIPIESNLRTLLSILELHFTSTDLPKTPLIPTSLPPSHRPSYSRSLSRASLPPMNDERPKAPRRRTSQRRLLAHGTRRGTRNVAKKQWFWKMMGTILLLTFLIAFPALSWYAAVPLTSMTDITAIYNVFAFWAYLLAIKFLGEAPSKSKLASVLVAIAGVMVIAYGDSFSSTPGKSPEEEEKGASRLLGNLLALFGSIAYAFYEVWYKLYVALPEPENSDDALIDDGDEEAEPEEAESLLASPEPDSQAPITDTSSTTSSPDEVPYPPPLTRTTSHTLHVLTPTTTVLSSPSTISFLLYSNFITASIGLLTLLIFWIPIPILHYVGWEVFEFPPRSTWLPILGTVLSGVVFNAGFMLLLSLWGPVIASVGNLCTLVLVALADTLVPTAPSLSKASLIGSGLIVASFAGLIIGAAREESDDSKVGDDDDDDDDENRSGSAKMGASAV